jgi:putative membrane protein
MGGMMGTMGAWMLVGILLVLALGVTGGIVIARGLHTRHSSGPAQIPAAGESPAVREAKDALRLRYANGEISREDYLQGKIELED